MLMGVSQVKLSLMLHGVRQGSILGPLFFILFIKVHMTRIFLLAYSKELSK